MLWWKVNSATFKRLWIWSCRLCVITVKIATRVDWTARCRCCITVSAREDNIGASVWNTTIVVLYISGNARWQRRTQHVQRKSSLHRRLLSVLNTRCREISALVIYGRGIYSDYEGQKSQRAQRWTKTCRAVGGATQRQQESDTECAKCNVSISVFDIHFAVRQYGEIKAIQIMELLVTLCTPLAQSPAIKALVSNQQIVVCSTNVEHNAYLGDVVRLGAGRWADDDTEKYLGRSTAKSNRTFLTWLRTSLDTGYCSLADACSD